MHQGAVKLAKKAGLNVVLAQLAPPTIRDFTPIITKLKSLNPDIVYISSFPPFAITLMKQAKELKLNAKAFHVIHHGAGFRKNVGPVISNFVTGEAYWTPQLKYGNYKLYQELLKRTGITASDFPWSAIRMYAYDVIYHGIEQAESLEPKKLIRALKELSIMTIGGPESFKENGVGSINPLPTQIQNGKYVTIWPKEFSGGKYIYPTPSWDKR